MVTVLPRDCFIQAFHYAFRSFAASLCGPLACGWPVLRSGLLKALFERGEDIDHFAAAAFGSRRRNCDLLALYLLIDDRKKPLAVFVVILFRFEFVAESFSIR